MATDSLKHWSKMINHKSRIYSNVTTLTAEAEVQYEDLAEGDVEYRLSGDSEGEEGFSLKRNQEEATILFKDLIPFLDLMGWSLIKTRNSKGEGSAPKNLKKGFIWVECGLDESGEAHDHVIQAVTTNQKLAEKIFFTLKMAAQPGETTVRAREANPLQRPSLDDMEMGEVPSKASFSSKELSPVGTVGSTASPLATKHNSQSVPFSIDDLLEPSAS